MDTETREQSIETARQESQPDSTDASWDLSSPPKRPDPTSSEFVTVMTHFYRGEITRANVWRQRLDATFNWAVLTTGTSLSFAFGSITSPHVVLLLNSLLITVFLFIEARRYRYYEVWSSRVRILETDYLAPLMSAKVRAVTPKDTWSEHLAEDLLRPHFKVGLWESVGRRLRRNYIWIFMLLAVSWCIKIAIHPSPVSNFKEFIIRASIGALSGYLVIAIGFIYNGILLAITFSTVTSRDSSSEVSTHNFERDRSQQGSRFWRRQREKLPDPEMTATFQPIEPRLKELRKERNRTKDQPRRR